MADVYDWENYEYNPYWHLVPLAFSLPGREYACVWELKP